MAIFKCKHCGEPLDLSTAMNGVCKCEICNMYQTVSLKVEDSPSLEALYGTASHFRKNNEFTEAISVYQQILVIDDSDAEAYFSVALCRYGIEYVKDPRTGNTLPTVNRTQLKAFSDDDDYQMALSLATNEQKEVFAKQAELIDEILKGYWAISNNEEPFDVFICYKETAEDGKSATRDSEIAQHLYRELRREGLKVFYARETLKGKLGSEYEPYIFAALNSARFMLAVGTKKEYFNAVWVKNEWSRYLSLIAKGDKKTLIPVIQDIDPYDMPKEFKNIQAQNYGEIGATDRIIIFITDILKREKPETVVVKETTTVVTPTTVSQPMGNSEEALIKRAYELLDEGKFNRINDCVERILNINFECGEAYFIKFLGECGYHSAADFEKRGKDYEENASYKKARIYADDDLNKRLDKIEASIRRRQPKGSTTKRMAATGKGVGDFVYFGSYPQTVKADNVTITGEQNDKGQYLGSDGEYYIKSTANPYYTSYKFSNGVTIERDKDYYFKVEPIKWKIIHKIGNKSLLISESIIDYCVFSSKFSRQNNYENSILRRWMTQDFYDLAFNDSEKELIFTTVVDNGAESTGHSKNKFACQNTMDKVFALSYKEMTNTDYGFNGDENSDSKRVKWPTDYAMSYSLFLGDNGSAGYWLRSPNPNYVISARRTSHTGFINDNIVESITGAVPAMWINLDGIDDSPKKKTSTESETANPSQYAKGSTWEIDELGILRFPKSTTKIKTGSFKDDEKIKAIIIHDKITEIEEAAFTLPELTMVSINSERIKFDGKSFVGSKALNLIIIGEGCKSHKQSQEGAMGVVYDSTGKELVWCPEMATRDNTFSVPAGVKAIRSCAFMGCKNLKRVEIPDTVTELNAESFMGCFYLESITVSGSSPAFKSIDGNLYSKNGESLIYIAPAYAKQVLTVPTGVKRMCSLACSGPLHLNEIKLPSTLQIIETGAVISGNYLSKINIPKSVTTVCNNAFVASNMLTVYCEAQERPSNWHQLWYTFDIKVKWGCYANGLSWYIDDYGEVHFLDGITEIANAEFKDLKNIKKAVIPEGVTSIGMEGFAYCIGLEEVILPSTLKSIGVLAFAGCDRLKSITLPNGLERIDMGAFDFCESLTSIVIPNSVKSIGKNQYGIVSGGIFSNCTALTSVTLPDGMERLCESFFSYCKSLADVKLPSTLKEIDGKSFEKCVSLKSIVLPEGITKIGARAFDGCTELREITFPTTLKELGEEAFADCTLIREVTIPDGISYLSNVVFKNCGILKATMPTNAIKAFDKSLLLKEVILTTGETIFEKSFDNWENLEIIHIPPTVKKIGNNAFRDDTEISQVHITDLKKWCEITFGEDSKISERQAACPLYYGAELCLNGKPIYELVIPDGVKAIKSYSFNGSPIERLVIGNDVETIEQYAFEGCFNLEEIAFPPNTMWWKNTDYLNLAFENCGSLKSIIASFETLRRIDSYYLEEMKFKKITINGDDYDSDDDSYMDAVIHSYETLEELVIADGVTRIANGEFEACQSLKSVTIASSVKEICQAISNCCALERIVIPEGVVKISESFNYCAELSEVVLPSTLTELNESFDSCDKLEKITIAEGNPIFAANGAMIYKKLPNGGIRLHMYAPGATEKKVIVPEGVTEIGGYAFRSNRHIEEIVLPESIQKIEGAGFFLCESLKDVYVGAGVRTVERHAFYGCKNVTVHCAVKKPSMFSDIPTGWDSEWNKNDEKKKVRVKWGSRK